MQLRLCFLAMIGMALSAPSPDMDRRQIHITEVSTGKSLFPTFIPTATAGVYPYGNTTGTGHANPYNATATAHASSAYGYNATHTASRHYRPTCAPESPSSIHWPAAGTNPPYWYLRADTDGTETTYQFDRGYLKEEYVRISEGWYSDDARIEELRQSPTVIFNNKCDRGFSYFESKHMHQSHIRSFGPHSVHNLPWIDPRAGGAFGGITFKLCETDNCKGGPIVQIEYSTNPDRPGSVWADISNVDCGSSRPDHNSEPCPFTNDGIMLLWPQMPDCPRQIAPAGSRHPPEIYNLPYDDWATMECPAKEGALEVILCPTVDDIEQWCGFDERWGPRCYPPTFFDTLPEIQ